jgi:hypothetical protein
MKLHFQSRIALCAIGSCVLFFVSALMLLAWAGWPVIFSLKERIFVIEIPSYNRLEGIAFSSVSFGRHLGVNGRGGIVSHVYADQRIVVWRGYDSAPFNQERVFKYSFYDAKSQRSISADSERALITAVDREFGMDIASLFPLPTLYQADKDPSSHCGALGVRVVNIGF